MLVFDIETNAVNFNDLPGSLTTITCLVVIKRESGRVWRYRGADINVGVLKLQQATDNGEYIGGQNVHGFDIPCLQIMFPWFKPNPDFVRDSKVESEMWYPANDLKQKDFAAQKRKRGKWIEQYLFGRHSLEAWGARLGCPKDNFSKRMKALGLDPWGELPPEYAKEREDYCEQDVVTNIKLFDWLESKFDYTGAAMAVRVENRVAPILHRQQQWGVQFNVKAAGELHWKLVREQEEVEAELKAEYFGPFYLRQGKAVSPKKTLRYKDKLRPDLTAGATYTKVKLVEFNAGSRQHIYKRLMTLYGWKPTQLTPSGEPQVDEKVLKGLDYPPCKLLCRYLLLEKRIGQLADGQQAWLRKERDGCIHGRVKQNGTRTTRASHVDPNMAQVPKVSKPYGPECRALFGPRPGRIQMGVDLSGIEMRAQGHYLHRYDGGKFAREVVEGDVHELARIAIQFNSRDHTKTFEYAMTYGSFDTNLGVIAYGDMTPEQQAKQSTSKKALTQLGKERRAMLEKGLTGMDSLVKNVKAAYKRGHIRALDGRKLAVPSLHSALNTLYQSFGGVVSKVWMVLFNDALVEAGLIPERSWYIDLNNIDAWKVVQMLYVHDELQNDCDPEYAEQAGELAVQAARATKDFLKLNVEIDAEYKLGADWAETH